MREVDHLLVGAMDLHAHLGPSVIPRKLDVVEALIEAKEAGMIGIVSKDHQFPTVAHAEIAQKHFGQDAAIKVYSGIALNNEVGGLNVYALETAINMGIKMVWMPTISTENHHVKHSQGGLKFPAAKKKSQLYKQPYIQIIDENGEVTEAVKRVLEVIAHNPDIVLCTGHGNAQEIDAIVTTAAKLGVKNILVNHPSYMIDASMEHMKKWIELGAYMEIGACTSDPESSFCNSDIDDTVAMIKELKAEHVILVSDFGQAVNPTPVEGLKRFFRLLLEKGISEDEIKIMAQTNPKKLMGLE